MKRTEPDLVAAREAATDVAGPGAQPSPDAVARTWSRITASPRTPRPWWRRVIVPASAAVAVLAVLATVIVLRPGPSQTIQIGAEPQPTAAAPTKPTPPSKVPPSVDPSAVVPTVAVTDPGTTVGPVPISRVVNEMVARSASVVPVTLTAGQLLYGCFESADKPANAQATTSVSEWWINPDTAQILKVRRDGQDMGGSEALTGTPGFAEPTREWLASLPTDPRVLYARLVDLNAGVKMGGASYVLKELMSLYRATDPVLTPAVRAALYRVLGRIIGLSATQVTVAGRKLYRVHQTGQVASIDLLLDPATGMVAGGRWDTTADDGSVVATIELWRYAVVDQLG